MPDEPRKEGEEIERLAVVMVARHDQLKMADKITALEARVKMLEQQLQHYFGTPVKINEKKPRRKACRTRSK